MKYWLITTSLHWSWNRSYNSPEKKQTKLANPCLFQKLYVFGHTKTQRWPKSSVAHRIHHHNLPFLNIMTIILFRFHWRLVLCVYSGCTVGSTHINKRVLLCPDVDCYDANFGFGLKWVLASNCLFAALTMHSCGEMEYIQRLLNNEKKNTTEGVPSYKMISSVLKFLSINHKIWGPTNYKVQGVVNLSLLS